MDIVLLNSGPNVDGKAITAYRTLGPYKIAHTCRANGYSVQVIDHCKFWDQQTLTDLILKFVDDKTLVLGLSSTFLSDDFASNIPSGIAIVVNYIKSQFPKLKIVIGGHSYAAAGFTPLLKADVAIAGFGEDIFLDVVNHIAGRGQDPGFEFQYNKKNGNRYKLYTNPLVSRFDIQQECFKFSDQDCILPNETLPLEISRGCIFKCKFCNHLLLGRGKLDYLRDFELVKDELIYNYEKWGITNYYIICDTFNDTEFKMQEWHKMVTSLPFKIKYTAYLRADLLDRFPDVPYLLKESGLYSAYHGIETFGKEAATVIGKGWSATSARDYLPKLYHDIWNKEVHQTLSFICGLPGDTRESLIDTAKWAVDNDMYNLSIHVLGLTGNKNMQKNLSEFERNSEKYGFTFPWAVGSNPNWGKWKTDYWNKDDVVKFVAEELGPIYHPTNARHGSWAILMFLQYGIDESMFLKENRNNWVLESVQEMHRRHLETYKQKLLAL